MWVFPDKLYALRKFYTGPDQIKSLFATAFADAAGWSAELPVFYPADCLDGKEEMFTKGDTHYSPRGEIEVMHAILEDVAEGTGERFRAQALPQLTRVEKRFGDLSRQVAVPRKDIVMTLQSPVVPATIVENRLRGNRGVMALCESPEAQTDKTLLVFGDSFLRSMLGHLAWEFRRIIFCRTQFFHSEIVDAVRPDVILGGAAERYLTSQAADATRPHFFSHPLLTGRPMRPEPGFPALFAKCFDQRSLTRTSF